jgi:hypothetical protein
LNGRLGIIDHAPGGEPKREPGGGKEHLFR